MGSVGANKGISGTSAANVSNNTEEVTAAAVAPVSQQEFSRELSGIKRDNSMTAAETENRLLALFSSAAIGTSITVDNRVLGGFRGSSSGVAYDFRKSGDNEWSEIFDDHSPVSNQELIRLLTRSTGFKRSRR